MKGVPASLKAAASTSTVVVIVVSQSIQRTMPLAWCTMPAVAAVTNIRSDRPSNGS
jgi:hypothetical protein